MEKQSLFKFSVLLSLFVASTICWADNPIVQTIYTADPAPMVYNGTCYVYTGHDADGARNYTMNDWRCYASTDMQNWTDLGSPLSYTNFSWAKGDCWAGQCIYRDGKFYYYVPMTRKTGGMAIGVAVSTSPTGPFTDPIGKPLAYTGTGDIDPTVYIDDDGQAYLYWGNPNLWVVKLNKDMISCSGSPVKVSSKPSNYVEGPWFYKRNGLYYLVFSSIPAPSEYIAYSTSTSPTGPWTYRGVIMPSGNCFTNHSGICDYKGNTYFFYHNSALTGGGSFTRSACVEQFKYNADGTIPTISATKNGPAQIGSLNPYVKIEAETICWESGVETEKCSEGGIDVCQIENGDYIKVKGVNFGTGAVSFEARVASATSGGKIELRLDSSTGTLVGTCAVTGTGGGQAWVTKTCTVSGATGIHDLYLKFTGNGGNLFNINWWKFNSGSVSPTPTQTIVPTPTPTQTIAPTPTPSKSATPTPTPTASQNPAGCSINYSQSDWGSGASVSIIIKNNGATAIEGWTLAWNFGGNQSITNMWNATYSQSGTGVAAKNASYNRAIPAKGTVSFGFNLSYSGTNAKPTSFTLNGAACQVE